MAGFCLGYLQGQKSVEKKMRKCPGGKLKCKNQIRQAIFYHISFLTFIPSLKLLMEFADILRRWDRKSQKESLTNEEWNQMVTVRTIMDCKNKEILQGIRQRKDGRYEARFAYKGESYTFYDTDLKKLEKLLLDKRYEVEHGIYAKETYRIDTPKSASSKRNIPMLDIYSHVLPDTKANEIQKIANIF